jgi:hypothetical protein
MIVKTAGRVAFKLGSVLTMAFVAACGGLMARKLLDPGWKRWRRPVVPTKPARDT